MTERSIRFGITNGKGTRASTWKCWTPGSGKHDVYLACRSLGGTLKASMHQSGNWHIAYTRRFFDENVAAAEGIHSTRFIEQWPRPTVLAPGFTLAFRIVTPLSAVSTPCDQPSSPHLEWIPNAPEGKATEIDVIITDPRTDVTSWPGKRSMGTQLVGSITLDSGETVWIVWLVVDNPKFTTIRTTAKYYKGRGPEDLRGKKLRALVFGNEKDGSRVVYDCSVHGTKPLCKVLLKIFNYFKFRK